MVAGVDDAAWRREAVAKAITRLPLHRFCGIAAGASFMASALHAAHRARTFAHLYPLLHALRIHTICYAPLRMLTYAPLSATPHNRCCGGGPVMRKL